MIVRCQHRMTRATRNAVLVLLIAAVWGAGIANTDAQTKKAPKRAKKAAPKFEDITLTTRDGVKLRCTYYPGPETKQTVPMILVHDWGGSRGELHPVALWMQTALKLTVIVPDLRGHGNSMRVAGFEKPIDISKFKGKNMQAMLADIETCKSFLLRENNEGKLNIEQLGIMGTGFGATLALKWAIGDWSVRNLPTFKQGQDIKALILLSPDRSFRGLTINTELKMQRILGHISVLTIVGKEDSSSMSDAQRINKAIERAWGDESKEAAPFFAAPTSLQSTGLLKARGTGIPALIAKFIELRLVRRGEDFPWTDRTSPLK